MRLLAAFPACRGKSSGFPSGFVTRVRGRAWISFLTFWLSLPVASIALSEEVVLGAAASLREPIQAMVDDFQLDHPETGVRVVFGASNSIARQIEFGAPIAVFLSADPEWVAYLVDRSLVVKDEPFPIASNRLALVKEKGSELSVHVPSDLASTEIQRVALPPPSVPLGRYARMWLRAGGLAESVESKAMVTEHAQATLAAVENGHADIAFVYESDAVRSDKVEIAYEIASQEQPRIVYSATRVGTDLPTEQERALVSYLKSPRARMILEEAGFGAVGSSDGPAGP